MGSRGRGEGGWAPGRNGGCPGHHADPGTRLSLAGWDPIKLRPEKHCKKTFLIVVTFVTMVKIG